MGRLWAAFFPERCVFCGGVIRYATLCCPACAALLPNREGYSVSPQHREGIIGFAAPLAYAGFAREKIVEMKSAAHKGYAPYFARRTAAAVRAEFGECRFDAVVCVPNLEPEGKCVYNPARVLARALAREIGAPLRADMLVQTRDKQRQHTLSAVRRAGNVRGLYRACGPEAALGKTLLLVDDVITTGATLAACAEALREAGAREIRCAAPMATLLEKPVEQSWRM